MCSQISVFIVFQDIGSYLVCKRDVHRYLCILCFRILVLGHTQCVRDVFTDFYVYFYAPNFGEVEGAYSFGPVRPSVRPSVCP